MAQSPFPPYDHDLKEAILSRTTSFLGWFMTGGASNNFGAPLAPALLFLFLAVAIMPVSGCEEAIRLQSPSREVKAFFVAGRDADALGTLSLSPYSVDLSAYSQFMEVKYPPTARVEVLDYPPSRLYKSFAVLEGETSGHLTSDELMGEFKRKAMEIGADAIILCSLGADHKIAPLTPSGKMQAVAIKYILTDTPGRGN
jgi:hypothetical protein